MSQNQNNLFNDLSDEQIATLKQLCTYKLYEPGEYLFNEGDPSRDLYVVLDGTVELTKKDSSGDNIAIAYIEAGDIIGDMSFIDGAARSANAKATTKVNTIKYDYEAIAKYPDILKILSFNISKNMLSKLRVTNSSYVNSLEGNLKQARTQNEFGLFFITVALTLTTFNAIDSIGYLYGFNKNSTLYSWLLIGIMLLPPLYMAMYLKKSLSEFGVNLLNSKQAIIESTALSVLCIAICVPILEALTHYNPALRKQLEELGGIRQIAGWGAANYVLSVYAQELIGRGFFQGSLQRFINRDKPTLAIFLTSLIFSVMHIRFGVTSTVLTFVASVVLGILFARHKTLTGIAILHFTAGSIGKFYGFI